MDRDIGLPAGYYIMYIYYKQNRITHIYPVNLCGVRHKRFREGHETVEDDAREPTSTRTTRAHQSTDFGQL